ncbi:murein L,D-transpeptidase catalytic domain family protein [Pontibacter harenae]|uniref:murein L,D-transpeptidase catalytic domain family protein n=1 Tax=Pontibacter harenae TaxID=2894083 RepID=UPI001E2CD2C2|nr:murein L,D-transpeptidase catalytic domain family protein [Pontibacter harenae]MCC9167623.1 murein L,D-transpeptidase catalytic domain family protein [Pontibacter harenae]
MQKLILTAFMFGLLSFTGPGTDNNLPSPLPEVEIVSASTLNNNTSLTFEEKQLAFEAHIQGIYEQAGLSKKGLSYDVFSKAMAGFQNMKKKGLVSSSKSVISVIDFSKSSRVKRLWIVDVKAKKLLFNSLVAHGKNTGQDKAVNFSNVPNSNMSSMGFYITDRTYYGKHGLSLKLSGVDGNYNSNAMSRAIVVHGADYVSEAFVKQYGRLGRSLGCPAIPQDVSKAIIENIKDKSLLYIHTADKTYKSSFLDEVSAVESFALEMPKNVNQMNI